MQIVFPVLSFGVLYRSLRQDDNPLAYSLLT
jgi:hypothetical protein